MKGASCRLASWFLGRAALVTILFTLTACSGGGSGGGAPTGGGGGTNTTLDSDNDGYLDSQDAFPNDPSEHADLDGDGIGDNADTDRDGDTYANDVDTYPDDPTRHESDLDNDGTPDSLDVDRDGDGRDNGVDAFPDDPSEQSDLDGDGIGDNADTDRDGDGRPNDSDAFPDDATEQSDLDGDGIGDNSDPDRDGDNVDNANDYFPDDRNASSVPAVIISSPSSLSTVGVSPVTVRGTVDDTQATVLVNEVAVAQSNGSFEAQVTLEEGANSIVVRAISRQSHEGTATVSISLDKTPPYVTVQSPLDGEVVLSDRITVSGLVNDIVRGTVADQDAIVMVNGVRAEVSNRTYLAQDIPLVEGNNLIEVTASDAVGNVGETRIQVTYRAPLEDNRIELISGQQQTGTIYSDLTQPLVVRLSHNGVPVVDKAVVFRVVEGDGLLQPDTDEEAQAALVTTNTEGLAQVQFRLGSRAGKATHRVRARAVGFEGEALFYASATPQQGDKIGVIAGNNQRGAIRQPLPQPFVVAVTDNGSNLIEGAEVLFKVRAGGGRFADGSSERMVTTDKDGRASVLFILGDLAGLDSQQVVAELGGTSANAGFTASAFIPADPGLTRISGVVLDNQDNPMPGVTIHLDAHNRQAVTDEEGRFTISEAPVGPVHLLADGSTTTIEGEWPTLSYNLVTVAGVDNPLASPIYLVRLDTEGALYVGKEDQVLTLDEVPGFKLEVKAGSVTFPDGAKEGWLSVTPVNADKIPMPPPNGMQPQFIVTIQPHGARFDPPARLTLPNVDGHAPGAEVEMYSYDHDLEEFVTIGLGTVSADASTISSNVGVGVIKAGWHCGSQPGGSGCCEGEASCGYCYNKVGSCPGNCELVPTRVAENQVLGNCRQELCSGSKPDDGDKPPAECGDCKDGNPIIDKDRPLKQQQPNDCRELLCGGGFNPKDETSALQADRANICKVCKDGSPAPGDEGKGCSDGTPEKACYTCKDGKCGNHCDADPATYTVEAPVPDFVNKALYEFKKKVNDIPWLAVDLKTKVSLKGTKGEKCCLSCETPGPRDYVTVTGSAGVGGSVKLSVPGLGLAKKFPNKSVGGGYVVKADILVTGLGASITLDATGSVSYTIIDCPDENCGTLSLSSPIKAKIGPQIDANISIVKCDLDANPDCKDTSDVVKVAGKGEATVNVSASVTATYSSGEQCGKSCAEAKFDPVTATANLSVTFKILGFSYSYTHNVFKYTIMEGGSFGNCN